MRHGTQTLIFALNLLLLTACGWESQRFAVKDSDSREFTGGKLPDGRAFTSSADDSVTQNLRNQVEPNVANKNLAAAILNVHTSHQGNYRRIQIQMKDTPNLHTFDVPWKDRAFDNIKSTQDPLWRLSGECDTERCERLTLKLKELDTSSSQQGERVQAHAAMVLRERQARIEARSANWTLETIRKSPFLSGLYTLYGKARSEKFRTLEVAWGMARFDLNLSANKNCLSGFLVATQEKPEALRACGGGSLSGTFELIGNTNQGSLLIAAKESDAELFLDILTEDTRDWKPQVQAPIQYIEPAPAQSAPQANPPQNNNTTGGGSDSSSPPPPVSPPTQRPPVPSGTSPQAKDDTFFMVNANHPVTRFWEKYRQQPRVQERIQKWARTRDIKEFLKRVQPNIDTMAPLLEEQGVPREFIFITLIESTYFKAPDFPLPASSTGALGPWQFLASTGRAFNLRVFPLEKGKANLCDERTHLKPSTHAAAQYFRKLFDLFPRDPGLAVMSYNWGQGNVGGALKRLQNINGAGFDFWSLERFNISQVPEKYIQYVIDFVAAQFFARNPKAYGIDPKLLQADNMPEAPEPPTNCQK